MSHPTAPARPGRKPQSRDAQSFTHFILGILLGTAGACAAQLLSGSPSNRPVGNVEAGPEDEYEPGPSAHGVQGGPATPPHGQVDSTSPWLHFWIGVALAVPVTAVAIWLYVKYPAGPDNAWLLVTYWAFMVVPGLSLAGLGVHMLRQRRRGLVMYALNRHDYLSMGLQFLPGTAIAVLGNLLPPDGAKIADGRLSISWISIILGTAVSIMLVRKFEEPNP